MVRESTIEKHLRKAVEKRGGLLEVFKFCSGVPDRVILLPEGIVAFLEVKRQGGIPRAQQVKRIVQIQRLGTKAGWVDSKESIEEFLNEISSENISEKAIEEIVDKEAIGLFLWNGSW